MATLVYPAGEENVHAVVVGGRVVMEHRRVTTTDEETALRQETNLGSTQWGQRVTVEPFKK